MTMQEEQAAFERALPALLPEHRGQHVLWQGGAVVDFFPSFEGAYRAGLDRFGMATDFVVAKVAEPAHAPISIAWEAGVMFP